MCLNFLRICHSAGGLSMNKVKRWRAMILILALNSAFCFTYGQGASNGPSGPQEMKNRMTQLIGESRSASDDQWQTKKKQILARIQSRMEQQNTMNPQVVATAVADIGKFLDNVRSLSEDQFRAQQEQAVQNLLMAMSSGMGRAGAPMPVAGVFNSGSPASKIQWIDVHNHLIGGPKHDYAGAIKAALAVMDQIGIQRMVVMPTPRVPEVAVNPDEINSFFNVVKQNSSRFAFMGGGESLNVLLQQAGRQPNVGDNLKKQFEQKANDIIKQGAVGFGEIAIHHLSLHGTDHPYENVPADNPLLLLLADIAAKNDVPIDIHFDVVTEDMPTPSWLTSANNPKVLHANLEAFERFLDHNPKAKICWAHAGSDNTGHWTVELSRRLLDKHQNLYMSLRMGPGHAPQNFPMSQDRQLRLSWLKLFQDYPSRFVIGSDNFIASSAFQGQGVAATLAKNVPVTRELIPVFLSTLPPELAQKIASENAMSLYKLKK